jgi:redox-sensitive bicupin YhaK (pirin superfamily)
LEGFQIWVNVPGSRKMDEPRYGSEPPEAIPLLQWPGASARVLAGECEAAVGPFKTVTPVQMVDYSLAAGASLRHRVPVQLDSALLFCYRGSGSVSGCTVKENSITLLDATCDARDIALQADRCARARRSCAVQCHARAAAAPVSSFLRARNCGSR